MNLNQQQAQFKIEVEWAKVTHGNIVKRIANPKPSLSEFIGQVQGHFKELRGLSYKDSNNDTN